MLEIIELGAGQGKTTKAITKCLELASERKQVVLVNNEESKSALKRRFIMVKEDYNVDNSLIYICRADRFKNILNQNQDIYAIILDSVQIDNIEQLSKEYDVYFYKQAKGF